MRAFNAFHALMLGLKMLPAYMAEQYEDFYSRVDSMSVEDQEKIIREAALFVELQKDELEAILSFAHDKNGVPYGPENLKNLGPAEIHEIIVQVCLEIAKIKVNFLTEIEKKK